MTGITVMMLAWLGSMGTAPASSATSTQPAAPVIELAGGTRLKFSSAGQPLSVSSLCRGQAGEWIASNIQGAPLWRLALRGPQAAVAELDGRQLPVAGVQSTDSTSRFTWETPLGDGRARIDLAVRIEPADQFSHWQLAATVPRGWRVVKADWPVLPNLRCEQGLKMAVPVGWGLEYDVTPTTSYEGTYPSLYAAMPFVAFYRDGHGLYFGLHDKRGRHKHLSVKARDDGVGITCIHWPCDADTRDGRYAPDHEAVLGAFDGDYWNAAQIYRAFTHQTPWGKDSKSVPAWLKDTDLWLIPDPQPLTNVEACRKARDFFGVPIGIHWYRWHEIAFDTLYPDYFPAKANFGEGVKAFKAAGFRVMPYINGRLSDPKSKAWTRDGLDKAAARQDNGEFYPEVYDTKIPLNVMCPASRQWQDEIAGIAHRLVKEYDVDGVYIDQIGAAGAVRCFSPDHSHSPGGGTLWSDGYREMLRKVRQDLPPDRILTTEENAECWDDQFDALLMVNTPAVGEHRIIPLMPTVYAGRAVTFGFQYPALDDLRRSLPFRAKSARQFLWGSQLGWIQVDWLLTEQARAEAEFLRRLARARRGGHEFLADGRFLGEVSVTGDNPRLQGKGGARGMYTIDLPAVMATAWLSADGGLGLAVVNLSDQARAVEIRPPWHRLKELGARSSVGSILGQQPARSGKEVIQFSIPAGDAQIVRFRSAADPS